MKKSDPIASIARWLAFLWLLPAIACNFPGWRPPPSAPSGADIRQTLTAQGIATLQPDDRTVTPGALPLPQGLATATAVVPVPGIPLPPPPTLDANQPRYITQPGDTLAAVALRFGVEPQQITSDQTLPAAGLLPPGIVLSFATLPEGGAHPSAVLPDSEVVYSPTAAGFSVVGYITEAGGYLSQYHERVDEESLTGAEIVSRLAVETSTNPRLLLAFLEFRSGWVLGQPSESSDLSHPIGFYVPDYRGLYKELSVATKQISMGYYGWREGSLTTLKYKDGSLARLSPELNAGSVGVQYLFSKLYDPRPWQEALYGPQGFLTLYNQMFGDPWQRAAALGPLLPGGLSQPPLELPFAPGERWSFTGGPHTAWLTGSPRGALDFAPITGERACLPSRAWARASAAGVVARSERNVVVVDLDGDGSEATGWNLLYLHLADQDRVAAGTPVNLDDPLGHPSCEGGSATGTHVHFARKFNGEWLPAGEPIPFVLSGWALAAGKKPYQGTLTKDGQVVSANPGGSQSTVIVR